MMWAVFGVCLGSEWVLVYLERSIDSLIEPFGPEYAIGKTTSSRPLYPRNLPNSCMIEPTFEPKLCKEYSMLLVSSYGYS